MSSVGTDYSSYLNTLNTTTTSAGDRMNDLTMSDFIKMMTAELQNQDPMDPMSNTEMLAQIGQMRQITSNDKLTTSIEAMSAGQTLATASSMIGKTITGQNTADEKITGVVDKVNIEAGSIKLYVGSSIVNIGSVTEIK